MKKQDTLSTLWVTIFVFVISVTLVTSVWAKDLFVATNGNDSVSYTNNDINNPWATPAKAWYNALAGDTVYFRAGTYTLTGQINTVSSGNHGTEFNKIEFTCYNDEEVTIKGKGDLVASFEIGKDWNYVHHLNFDGNGDNRIFRVGYDATVEGFVIEDCTATGWKDDDNSNFVYAGSTYASCTMTKLTVQRCTIKGNPSGSYQNYSGIQVFGAEQFTIANNDISQVVRGIYLKHSSINYSDHGDVVKNNYIHDLNSSAKALRCNMNYVTISNNIFDGDVDLGEDAQSSRGSPRGNYNIWDHNTFMADFFQMDDGSCGIYNSYTNNVFVQTLRIYPYSGDDANSKILETNYNLYPSGNVVLHKGTNYSLANWKTHMVSEGSGGSRDANSISGAPTFSGGASPSSIMGFALAESSLGKNAADDGKDLGAEILKVGITDLQTILDDTTSPTITIFSPTSQSTYSTNQSTLTISGSTSDNVAVTAVTWSDNNSRTGSATLNGSQWAITDYDLYSGTNIINIVAMDEAQNEASAAITITYNPSVGNVNPNTPIVDSVQIASEDFGPEVIFYDDFEDAATLSQKYADYDSASGSCDIISTMGLGGSSKSVRARWTLGQVNAGAFAYMFGRNPSASQSYSTSDFREVYWRFYVKMSKGWSGNPMKLTRATILAASDWSQAMIAHIWGESGDNLLEMEPATGIDSNNNLVTTGYNDFNHLAWLGISKGITPIYETSVSNTWRCVEVHVKLNKPGSSDGIFEFWIDGNLEARRADLNWVGRWQNYGINMIMFDNYWNNGAPCAQERYMDNIVISTKPIGMASSAVNPYIYKSAFESTDDDAVQSAFYAQVSTSPDIAGLVWSGGVSGSYDALPVDTYCGTFQGSLVSKSALDYSKTYYVRVRQVDNQGFSSEWSVWKIFKTQAATDDSTPPLKPIGLSINVIP